MPLPHRSGPPRPVAARNPQQRPGTQKVEAKAGPSHAVPCPWCQHKMDFRAHCGQDMGGVGEGEIGLETGAVFSCEKCKRFFKITDLAKVLMIKVAPIQPPPKRR